MRKKSTEYSNFKRFMTKMESEKKKRELLYKSMKKGGKDKDAGSKAKNGKD